MALSAEYWIKLLACVEGTNKRAFLDSGITLRTRSEQQAEPGRAGRESQLGSLSSCSAWGSSSPVDRQMGSPEPFKSLLPSGL